MRADGRPISAAAAYDGHALQISAMRGRVRASGWRSGPLRAAKRGMSPPTY